MLRPIWRAHQRLPLFLQLPLLLSTAVTTVFVFGIAFTLPPGPLCDEGMVLFMEGGCDWGESNIFFHSKLGTMVVLHAAWLAAWRTRVTESLGFVPHFAAAGVLALATRDPGMCETYYDHPNGNVGQMVVELAAYAWLGLALVCAPSARPIGWMMAGVLTIGWLASYVIAFYVALLVTPHWTWLHTLLIVGQLLLLAAGVEAWARGVAGARATAPA